ncbi:hypothetical protein CCP1ISM_1640001 [Azospirillaceae bacterium]
MPLARMLSPGKSGTRLKTEVVPVESPSPHPQTRQAIGSDRSAKAGTTGCFRGTETTRRQRGGGVVSAVFRMAGQVIAYSFFGFLVGYLSNSPAYTWFPADRGQIKLSFSYGASRQADCRQRTAEELSKLAANMRKPMECKRERRPLYLEMRIDGELMYQDWLQPTGLSHDGPSRIYRLFQVPAGRHKLLLGLRETARTEGFDFVRETEVDIKAQQNFVVDFRNDQGGFIFK